MMLKEEQPESTCSAVYGCTPPPTRLALKGPLICKRMPRELGRTGDQLEDSSRKEVPLRNTFFFHLGPVVLKRYV